MFKVINPNDQTMVENYRIMISSIAPRPIAFVGTQNKKKIDNLAPYSFFNGFGANPPIIGFSPALSGRTGKPKDTLVNISETSEFTVSMVSRKMSYQMTLSSCEYDQDVDEFVKSGFTKYKSQFIKPYGVTESPIIFECKLIDIIKLGDRPGSGNLILGEIILFHLKETHLSGDNLDQSSLNLIGRMGGDKYSDTSLSSFSISKPKKIGIGYDAIPDAIKKSNKFSGNELGKLASIDKIPSFNQKLVSMPENELYEICKSEIRKNNIARAWQIIHLILKHE